MSDETVGELGFVFKTDSASSGCDPAANPSPSATGRRWGRREDRTTVHAVRHEFTGRRMVGVEDPCRGARHRSSSCGPQPPARGGEQANSVTKPLEVVTCDRQVWAPDAKIDVHRTPTCFRRDAHEPCHSDPSDRRSRCADMEAIDVPTPGAGEALIRQTASGLNYIDVYHRSGLYPVSSMPASSGARGPGSSRRSGTVSAKSTSGIGSPTV